MINIFCALSYLDCFKIKPLRAAADFRSAPQSRKVPPTLNPIFRFYCLGPDYDALAFNDGIRLTHRIY